MTFTQKLIAFIVIVVLGAGIYGGYEYPVVKTAFGTTTAGGTGTTARQYNVYGIASSVPGSNATSSSITNNTGNDLYITAVKIGCESVGTSKAAYSGGGLSAFTLTIGTTTTSAPAAAPAAPLGGTTFTIGTSTATFVIATSTVASGASTSTVIWANGQIETFWLNATNTAVCTFGLDVTSS